MQRLEIETPEHVVLDLEIAGVGSRALAALIDSAILFGGGFALLVLVGILAGYGVELGPWGDAILVLFVLSAWYLYFIFFEGLRRGQTPGKRIVGIRVVSDTGHGVTFAAAAVRNLLRLADLLPPPYLTGVVLAALHPRGKRLGDLVAGTVVVRDRPAAVGPARPAAAEIAPSPEIPALSDAEFRLLGQFESRHRDLAPAARGRLAERLVERVSLAVPPGAAAADHLLEVYARELHRRQGRLGAVERGGLALRLAARKEARWDEFQRLAERAARSGLDSFAAHELPDFAARYREVAADLARARTYRADPPTLARLERLVAAGHNALYREQRHTWRQIWRVVVRECPAAVVQSRRYVAVACLAFALPAAASYTMLRERPGLAASILPEAMLRRAEVGTERQAAGRKYFTADAESRPVMASGIISNNVRVAIACFAGGIFLGVGSLFLLAFNGVIIGASAGHFANMGLLGYLLEFILGHGALELFAIWVAGAAGFLLGRAAVAPGNLSRADALVLSGRTALRMVGAAVVMLAVAGLIEGFISAGGADVGPRLAASGGSLVFLGLYLANGRAVIGPAASRASGSPTPRSPAG